MTKEECEIETSKAIIEMRNHIAELKEEIKNNEDLATVAYMQGAENQKKKTNKQLTKAKEIIKGLLESCFGYASKSVNYEIKAQAEQFLKEE